MNYTARLVVLITCTCNSVGLSVIPPLPISSSRLPLSPQLLYQFHGEGKRCISWRFISQYDCFTLKLCALGNPDIFFFAVSFESEWHLGKILFFLPFSCLLLLYYHYSNLIKLADDKTMVFSVYGFKLSTVATYSCRTFKFGHRFVETSPVKTSPISTDQILSFPRETRKSITSVTFSKDPPVWLVPLVILQDFLWDIFIYKILWVPTKIL